MKRKVYVIEAYRYPTPKAEAEEDLAELLRLVDAAGWEIVGSELYQLRKINPDTVLGKGKLEDLNLLFTEFRKRIGASSKARRQSDEDEAAGIDLVVFDFDLKPFQIKKIEDYFNIEVSDRTRLILEIFKKRAKSAEGKLQVELAESEYEIGRLTGGRGLELSRLGGGVGTRGPGEKIAEKDKRAYKRKIKSLKEKLKKVKKVRDQQSKKRVSEGYKTITLVGYTNAGKSTLLNTLTSSKAVRVRDELFTTVDPTTRVVCLEQPIADYKDERFQQLVLVTDTVGFIRRLPHELVEGFESTLGQVKQSDLVLAVIDVADKWYEQKEKNVFETLKRIGCHVPILKVYNKFDLMDSSRQIDTDAVYISARTGEGLDELKNQMMARLK